MVNIKHKTQIFTSQNDTGTIYSFSQYFTIMHYLRRTLNSSVITVPHSEKA